MLASTLSKNAPFIDIPVGIALALSHAIIDTVRDPLLVLDQDQRIIAASRSFYQTFKLAGQDVRGQLLFDIDGGQWNIPELRELLETIAKDQATIEGYEVDREFPVIGRRIMLLNVRKVFYEKGTHTHRIAGIRGCDRPARRRAAGAGAAAGKGHAAGGNAAPRRQQSANHRQHPAHQGAHRPVGGDAIAIGGRASARSVGRRRPKASA